MFDLEGRSAAEILAHWDDAGEACRWAHLDTLRGPRPRRGDADARLALPAPRAIRALGFAGRLVFTATGVRRRLSALGRGGISVGGFRPGEASQGVRAAVVGVAGRCYSGRLALRAEGTAVTTLHITLPDDPGKVAGGAEAVSPEAVAALEAALRGALASAMPKGTGGVAARTSMGEGRLGSLRVGCRRP